MKEEIIDGIPHVLVPKEQWENLWAILDRVEQLGE